MSDNVQKIKKEIERIIEEETPISKGSDYYHGAKESMEKLLKFIDSLQEESKCIYNRTLEERKKFCKYCSAFCTVRIKEEPVNEDLKEEIKNWIKTKHFVFTEIDEVIETAKYFAEWQKHKDQETIELAEDHAMLAGMNKMKEKMMGNAVEAQSRTFSNAHGTFLHIKEGLPTKDGDKVKIIIIKED